MRRILFGALSAVLLAPAADAAPLARAAPAAEGVVRPAQDRMFPRFFGGGQDERQRERAALTRRIERLEEQVRTLTGEVETLSFTVRRLERALDGQGGLSSGMERPRVRRDDPAAIDTDGDARDDRRGALGGAAPDQGGNTASNPPGALARTGPIDLSAINRDSFDLGAEAEPETPEADPVTTPEIEEVRELQRSGRYAMAAREARKVLTDNPTGPVGHEARFLLGEALLEQGSYRDAANRFLENYTSDPSGIRAPQSLLNLAVALNRLGENQAACSSLSELLNAYPDADRAVRAAAERELEAAGC